MSANIQNLEPKSLWKNFALLNAVPRASKKEKRVIEFAKNFGEKLGLETTVDDIGNVIIKKPASAGMENRTTIVMQSHLDMVHQKNTDTEFDFDTEGIKMLIEGDWVRADGTTLGADNGIGVATIMALLESTDIPHPPLEALFTIDEETGMTGALGLKGGYLNGKIMLNLDTEDDHELTIGCAGGIDVTADGTYDIDNLAAPQRAWKVILKGLAGGHSGMEIHLGKGNANKLMNRFLLEATKKLNIRIHSINGGGLRNAIPRESFSIVTVDKDNENELVKLVGKYLDIFQKEYQTTDPELTLQIEPSENIKTLIPISAHLNMLRSIYTCPNGIYRMSPDIKDLVQTSNNVARVLVENGKYKVLCLTRSSVDSEKIDEVNSISSAFELIGANVSYSGAYPGWTPKPGAEIVKIMSNLYQEMFDGKADVNACHAGLECGILGTNYPEMEMISFGPNIRGAHSPDEKVQISSVQNFWKYLLETLKRIP
jgi:dipeptidase D